MSKPYKSKKRHDWAPFAMIATLSGLATPFLAPGFLSDMLRQVQHLATPDDDHTTPEKNPGSGVRVKTTPEATIAEIEPDYQGALQGVRKWADEPTPRVSAREAFNQLQEIYATEPIHIVGYWIDLHNRVEEECGGNVNRCAVESGIRQDVLALNGTWKRGPAMLQWEKEQRVQLDELVSGDSVLTEAVTNWESYSEVQQLEVLKHYAQLHTKAFSDGPMTVDVPEVLIGDTPAHTEAVFSIEDGHRKITYNRAVLAIRSLKEAIDAMEHELRHNVFYVLIDGSTNEVILAHMNKRGIADDVRAIGVSDLTELQYHVTAKGEFSKEYHLSITEQYADANSSVRSSRLIP